MGMDKYWCFIQMYAYYYYYYYYYYYWSHSQQSMKTRHVSRVIDVFQRMCSYLLKKRTKNARFPLLLFLCTEQFTHKPVYIFAGQGNSTSPEHAKCTYIITFVTLSVPTYCIWMITYYLVLLEGSRCYAKFILTGWISIFCNYWSHIVSL